MNPHAAVDFVFRYAKHQNEARNRKNWKEKRSEENAKCPKVEGADVRTTQLGEAKGHEQERQGCKQRDDTDGEMTNILQGAYEFQNHPDERKGKRGQHEQEAKRESGDAKERDRQETALAIGDSSEAAAGDRHAAGLAGEKDYRGFGIFFTAEQILADAEQRFRLAEYTGAVQFAIDDAEARASAQVIQEPKDLVSWRAGSVKACELFQFARGRIDRGLLRLWVILRKKIDGQPAGFRQRAA